MIVRDRRHVSARVLTRPWEGGGRQQLLSVMAPLSRRRPEGRWPCRSLVYSKGADAEAAAEAPPRPSLYGPGARRRGVSHRGRALLLAAP